MAAQQQRICERRKRAAEALSYNDNSLVGGPRLIASGAGLGEQVHDPEAWRRLQEGMR